MQIFPGDACCYDSLNTQGAETGVEHFIESVRVFLVYAARCRKKKATREEITAYRTTPPSLLLPRLHINRFLIANLRSEHHH